MFWYHASEHKIGSRGWLSIKIGKTSKKSKKIRNDEELHLEAEFIQLKQIRQESKVALQE